jgi:hypothetical protein
MSYKLSVFRALENYSSWLNKNLSPDNLNEIERLRRKRLMQIAGLWEYGK